MLIGVPLAFSKGALGMLALPIRPPHQSFMLVAPNAASRTGGILKQQGSPGVPTCLRGSSVAHGRAVRDAQVDLTCGGMPRRRRQGSIIRRGAGGTSRRLPRPPRAQTVVVHKRRFPLLHKPASFMTVIVPWATAHRKRAPALFPAEATTTEGGWRTSRQGFPSIQGRSVPTVHRRWVLHVPCNVQKSQSCILVEDDHATHSYHPRELATPPL
jgi:hypothetical protein